MLDESVEDARIGAGDGQPDASLVAGGDPLAGMGTGVALLWLAVGLGVLLGGSKILVWGAVAIAHLFGVSDLIIGLTVVAIGTSLPELAASVMSVLKNEHDDEVMARFEERGSALPKSWAELRG